MKINFFSSVISGIFRIMPAAYYAVAKGRKPGIYSTWDQCKAQVHQFPGPVFKKFSSESEAKEFVNQQANRVSRSNNNKIFIANDTQKNKETALKIGPRPSTTGKRTIKTLSHDDIPVMIKKRRQSTSTNESSCSEEITPEGFTIDGNGYISVYTDGACSSNGRKGARAGIGVWFGDKHPLNVSQAVVGRATNNMAEIQAVTVAAHQAHGAGITKLKINTDSKFLISCITQWMPKWKANGWKTATGKSVINKTELIEMEKALKPLNIVWNHVSAHVGIHGNEMADKFARDGSARY